MSHLFAAGGQSIGASASASAPVLSMNIQGYFPLELTGLNSLLSRGLSRVFSSLTASILYCLAFFTVQLTSTHDYWKNHSFDYTNVCQHSDIHVLICCLGMSWLFSQGASVLNFMAAVSAHLENYALKMFCIQIMKFMLGDFTKT